MAMVIVGHMHTCPNTNPIPNRLLHTINVELEMWVNAQRDGRPAEYTWYPLFNAAKFGWRPLLDAVQ